MFMESVEEIMYGCEKLIMVLMKVYFLCKNGCVVYGCYKLWQQGLTSVSQNYGKEWWEIYTGWLCTCGLLVCMRE